MKYIIKITSYYLGSISLGILLSSAIAADGNNVQMKLTASQKTVECQEPRPKICYLERKPVCGLIQQASEVHYQTFTNDCLACADKKVIGYQEGICR